MPDYEKYAWFYEAINGVYPKISGVRKFFLKPINIINDFVNKNLYYWKIPSNYQQTNWFKFQEAVKDHQKMMKKILNDRIVEWKQLEEW